MFNFDIYHRTYDLTSPWPWVMTNFELMAFWSAIIGVGIAIWLDMRKNRSKKSDD